LFDFDLAAGVFFAARAVRNREAGLFFGGGGAFAPSLRASDRPIAIACFGLRTFRCDRPDSSLPSFILCIARSTLAEAFGPYFRFPEVDMQSLPDLVRPTLAAGEPQLARAVNSLGFAAAILVQLA
jgi:hypothetical protein